MAGQNEVNRLIEEMLEHICDELCRHPWQAEGQEELEHICAECRVGEYVCGILNAHNREATKQRWIPVEERLPEPGQIVLVCQIYSWMNFEDGAQVTIGRLRPADETHRPYWEFQHYRPDFKHGTIMDNGIICPGKEYVTHWMPLPEPYRPKLLQEAGADAGEYGDAPTLRPAT